MAQRPVLASLSQEKERALSPTPLARPARGLRQETGMRDNVPRVRGGRQRGTRGVNSPPPRGAPRGGVGIGTVSPARGSPRGRIGTPPAVRHAATHQRTKISVLGQAQSTGCCTPSPVTPYMPKEDLRDQFRFNKGAASFATSPSLSPSLASTPERRGVDDSVLSRPVAREKLCSVSLKETNPTFSAPLERQTPLATPSYLRLSPNSFLTPVVDTNVSSVPLVLPQVAHKQSRNQWTSRFFSS